MPNPVISALVFSPRYEFDRTIFAGTVEDGVLCSTDGGSTWFSWNFQLVDHTILSLAISPQFPQDHRVFAGTSTGLYCSHNGGRAWQEVDLPCGYQPVTSLAAVSEQIWLVGTESDGLFRLEDGGSLWERRVVSSESSVLGIVLGPEGRILANLGTELLFSVDTGRTWLQHSLIPDGEGEIISVLRCGDRILVALSDGRILRA